MKNKYNEHQKQAAEIQRKEYINSGYNQAKKQELLHIKACMLYWAEGTKNKRMFEFTNCDIETHKIVVDFLKKYFPDCMSKLKLRLGFYPSQENSYDVIKNYWMKNLNLDNPVFYKPTDRSKYYTTPKINKYPMGILKLQMGSVLVIYNILGAINFYVGKDIYNENSFRGKIPTQR